MPFQLPDLPAVRRMNRDNLAAYLEGADATVPNSALRVLSDQNAGGAYLNILYLAWLARNFLPDQAEREWLDRWANILFGGRKAATYASGAISITGTPGVLLPAGSIFATSDGVQYQTTTDTFVGNGASSVNVGCLSAGAVGNRDQGALLSLTAAIAGIDAQAAVTLIDGGADAESDDDLRVRVLLRIRRTPMGGDADDYVQWVLAVPGVTRAWVAPLEMGIGTVTVRFMCDQLRANSGGFPNADDILAVRTQLDTVRPVAVKDFFVEPPLAQPLAMTIRNLSRDTPSTRVAIEAAVRAALADRAAPGQTIYRSWIDEAISGALGEDHHDLDFDNAVMPTAGHMAVLANILYA
ncbi:baseplate J/gp47 family protein [Methylobacterium gnaphalii]|uniref:Tail protein n=1 Tax=Methylobacterium gnaphalii TaxID=1010610 RepID=A0A512JIL5_9HYPH|nr:baseplate J/gp47 family protein [Methylobacterium gnaphalii]GEP09801.1 tail protein [Methylobacterium gnaphalii]GJD67284.1 hypothetical protein MMMDOFMJ_0198 [Methylobacterium gnaphalii]GLS49831.1 tail protein [Methylobacterium gnaphalii]